MSTVLRALLLWALGALGALTGAEVLLRVLPVPQATRSGYTLDPMVLTYPPRHRWRVATGWDLRNPQLLTSNNLGFPSQRDFLPDPDAVALIGDSYVEASMLSAADRPDAQLERALGGQRPVYAMGGPGSSLLDYAQRVRLARSRLGVRDVVLLVEAGDVRQALCGSGNVHAVCLDRDSLAPRTERQPGPSLLAQYARHVALAQYFVGLLKLDLRSLVAQMFQRHPPGEPAVTAPAAVAAAPRQPPAFVDAVTQAWIDALRRSGPGRLVVVVDGKRSASAAMGAGLALERRRFIDLARAAGLEVIDAEPIYAAHAGRSARSLDVGPYDGHLNPLGVGLVMRAAAQALRAGQGAP